MIDLTVSTDKPTSLSEIISAFRVASKSSMAGVLKVTDEELVSTDYNGSSYSAIIDAPACAELNPQVCSDVF
jgi:glyceraldehyde 3-phosphate dehydrogenase